MSKPLSIIELGVVKSVRADPLPAGGVLQLTHSGVVAQEGSLAYYLVAHHGACEFKHVDSLPVLRGQVRQALRDVLNLPYEGAPSVSLPNMFESAQTVYYFVQIDVDGGPGA